MKALDVLTKAAKDMLAAKDELYKRLDRLAGLLEEVRDKLPGYVVTPHYASDSYPSRDPDDDECRYCGSKVKGIGPKQSCDKCLQKLEG